MVVRRQGRIAISPSTRTIGVRRVVSSTEAGHEHGEIVFVHIAGHIQNSILAAGFGEHSRTEAADLEVPRILLVHVPIAVKVAGHILAYLPAVSFWTANPSAVLVMPTNREVTIFISPST